MATSESPDTNHDDKTTMIPQSNLPPIANLSLTQDLSHNPSTRPHKRYRPKSSSLPTSLVRTFHLHDHNTSNPNQTTTTTTPTEITLQLFSDRTFLSLTQLHGKIGSLFLCSIEESVIDNSTTYEIRTLLGTGVANTIDVDKEVAFREVLVRRIAEGVVRFVRRGAGVSESTILGGEGGCVLPPLVVGVGLRPGGLRGVDQLREMVDAVMEVYEEGWRRKTRVGGGLVGMEGPD
ncbi:hypothetical protein HJC23_001515 [Cyclotella cryptica]|uniref:Proteasome assembly chaperone 3 n=1 Tax=Cyclotella cryptica TaxID=29204 RepID=A0ABD3P9S0_9STRA|eukprot:CCRYP_017411-RA/>CCRYP_017411-RA protein AED:0.03 eAED:0.03 QI:0/-1/0/1/-1/1/1/0/233